MKSMKTKYISEKSISILIPVYNYDCSSLIRGLHTQAEDLRKEKGLKYEIIVGDDASENGYGIEHVKKVCRDLQCRYMRAERNKGRSANRNDMAREARYRYLLFIDCDALLPGDDFLKRYYSAVGKNTEVMVGGIKAVSVLPSPDRSLRYKYEHEAEHIRSLGYRMSHKYQHFSTFNFLIRRDIFLHIRFDESITDYGFEDTLFGLRLRDEHAKITHIDAPLFHNGLESNDIFLAKTERSLRTLHRLGKDLQKSSHIGKTAMIMDKSKLTPAFIKTFGKFVQLVRKNLLGKNPSMRLFKLYKLWYYCSLNYRMQ